MVYSISDQTQSTNLSNSLDGDASLSLGLLDERQLLQLLLQLDLGDRLKSQHSVLVPTLLRLL